MNKNIFSYSINGETFYADPLRLERRWQRVIEKTDIDSVFKNLIGPDFIQNIDENGIAHDPEGNVIPQATPEVIRSARARQAEAADELTPLLYSLFEVLPINPKTGEGVAEDDVWTAFSAFQSYADEVKKNTNMNPSLPQSTINSSTSETTNDSAASTGTVPEPSQSDQSLS